MEKIKTLWFKDNRIYMRSQSGIIYSRPLEAYPELQEASDEQRNDYTIGDDGEDVRWETLDVDMHVTSFLEKTEPELDNEVAALFNRFPWLNVSSVAHRMNINKSLLARYIYGISKPSPQRIRLIKDTLHQMGKELVSA